MRKEFTTRIGNISAELSGQGPTLILLYANPGCHKDFDAVAPFFETLPPPSSVSLTKLSKDSFFTINR